MAESEAPEPGAYRAYKAACPGCGAPVAFRSAASTHAVCGYCSSTIVREGEALKRIGKMAELFDDHSPLQLGASGVFEGKGFTVAGRLQYAWKDGRWTEWHCVFDGEMEPSKATGWLSEDNGQYVFMREVPLAKAPELAALRVGANTAWQGKRFQISALTQVHLSSAQGELPKLPPLSREFTVAELRSDDGTVLSLDYGQEGGGAKAYLGSGVQLKGLQLQGLRDDLGKDEKGARQFSCPHCGAPIQLKLEASKSITCGSCASVIDTSAGPGQEVLAALQTEPVRPTIALGTVGTLFSVKWQVLGFQHRMGQSPGDDESFGWDEYLLYEPKEGFAFVVDASDGWSFVRPLSGAPSYRAGDSTAKYLGKNYTLKYQYNAETTYVAGEFYWKASRGAKTFNSDFANGETLLSREQSKDQGTEEITWSRGNALDADEVAQAFGLKDKAEDLVRGDVSPLGGGISLKTLIIIFVLFILLAVMLSMCSSKRNCDPERENCERGNSSGYRSGTSGGSYGGWSGGGGSSGGGHK